MKDMLIKFLLILVSTSVFVPLAYLGITHGSSYGLEGGIFCIFMCTVINYLIMREL